MYTSASTLPVVEDEADFHYLAGKPLKTWYRITGDMTPTSIPLIILHGGPGVGSEAYNAFVDLTNAHSIPIIQYDQVGCKRSTHLQDKADAGAEFWNENLFVAELHSLIKHLGLDGEGRQYCVLGHSWGGMFGTTFSAGRPKGLRKYIIMSSAGSIDLWVEAQNKLRRTLPKEVQDVMDRCEKNGTTESDEYQGAMLEYYSSRGFAALTKPSSARGPSHVTPGAELIEIVQYSRFLCRLDPVPEEIMDGLGELSKDSTTYSVMWGPSELFVTGTLKDWSALDYIHKINVPVLLLNGRYDEAQDSCMVSFFDRLDKVKWIQFAESAHMAQYEERERCMKVVADFLTD